MLDRVSLLSYNTVGACTHLLVWVHRSKSALMARLPTLASNVLNLLVRSVGEVTGVGVVRHYEEGSGDSVVIIV